jgi:hypothetical protein
MRMRITLVAFALAATACGGGVHDDTLGAHECDIFRSNDVWESIYVTVFHEDPRVCPRPEWTYSVYSAQVETEEANVEVGTQLKLGIYDWQGDREVGYDEEFFYRLAGSRLAANPQAAYISSLAPDGDYAQFTFPTWNPGGTAFAQLHVNTYQVAR